MASRSRAVDLGMKDESGQRDCLAVGESVEGADEKVARPSVSVVIPSYNHARFLQEAIGSVQAQTLSDLEIIVIDDGSTDGSFDLVQNLATEDRRIVALRQANAGSHATINRGVRMARAPWIAILNSDDRWAPNRLEKMLAAAESTGAQFLFSDMQLIGGDGRAIKDPHHWWNATIDTYRARVRDHGLADGLLYGNLTVSTSNFLFRQELFQEIGPFRHFRYNLDWDFALRCILHCPDQCLYLADDKLLDYRLHGDNTILQGMPGAAVEATQIQRHLAGRQFQLPKGFVLSLSRNQRLLRRFLSDRTRQLSESVEVLTADRDRIAALAVERQTQFEHAIDALTADRDRIAALAVERQTQFEHAIDALTADRDRIAALAVERQTQFEQVQEKYERLRTVLPIQIYLGARSRIRALKQGGLATFRRQAAQALTPTGPGSSGHGVVRPVYVTSGSHSGSPAVRPSIGVHVHLYYLDLADELFAALANIPSIDHLVITGPWSEEEVRPWLQQSAISAVRVDIDQVPNRGKDIGGFLHALRERRLDHCDLILKIHSKKSLNSPTYFEAVSTLLNVPIRSGDDWRHLLLESLIGTKARVASIIRLMAEDPKIGLAGPSAFFTTAPDANAARYRDLCKRLSIEEGAPFVAGTMFWIRSEVLQPLHDLEISLLDFTVGSSEVEGELEHSFERIFGALSIARGLDLGALH
jgi:glycosyltransferase involved in cell wall biosynthesis